MNWSLAVIIFIGLLGLVSLAFAFAWSWPRRAAAAPPEARPVLGGSRTIYDLDVRAERQAAGIAVRTFVESEAWRSVRAIADWLRLHHAEAGLPKAKALHDAAFAAGRMLGRAEGAALLLDRVETCAAEAKKLMQDAEAQHAAEVLVQAHHTVPIGQV